MNLRFFNQLKKKQIIVVVSFVLLLVLLAGLNPFLRVPFISISELPLKLFTLIRQEIGGIIFYHCNYIQNEKLRKEIDFLKQKLNAANEARLENERLKNLLSFKEKSSLRVIAARVIGRSADSWSSVIIIDKGRTSGIKRGYVAITYLGLAGRVIETAASASKIILLNDPNLGVSCIVQRSRQEGLVSGTLGTSLIMKYLPEDSDIKISDVIVTSGLTAMYPKGLLVGKVVEVGEELSGLTRYAIIKPAVNLSDLEEVLIIIP